MGFYSDDETEDMSRSYDVAREPVRVEKWRSRRPEGNPLDVVVRRRERSPSPEEAYYYEREGRGYMVNKRTNTEQGKEVLPRRVTFDSPTNSSTGSESRMVIPPRDRMRIIEREEDAEESSHERIEAWRRRIMAEGAPGKRTEHQGQPPDNDRGRGARSTDTTPGPNIHTYRSSDAGNNDLVAVEHLEFDLTPDLDDELEEFGRLTRLGHYRNAKKHFKQFLQEHIDHPIVFVSYAEMLLDVGDYKSIVSLEHLSHNVFPPPTSYLDGSAQSSRDLHLNWKLIHWIALSSSSSSQHAPQRIFDELQRPGLVFPTVDGLNPTQVILTLPDLLLYLLYQRGILPNHQLHKCQGALAPATRTED